MDINSLLKPNLLKEEFHQFRLTVNNENPLYCEVEFHFIGLYMITFRLQKENDSLLGKHSAHSQQLQNEIIDWPDKVEVRFVPFCKT